MTRSAPTQRSFSSGEVSPLLAGRTDYQRHQTGLATCRGFLPLVEGGFTRAPGTSYLGRTRGDAAAVLVAFEFSAEDAVTLEFTAGYMRVWRYGSLVMDGASPFELVIPYDLAAIRRLKYVQSADVIFLVDGERPPQKLSRFALDNWTIAATVFDGGPFRAWNLDEDITIVASAATGTVTLTASGGDVFLAGYVGGLFALRVDNWDDTPIWTGNTTIATNAQMRYDGRVYRRSDDDSVSNAPTSTGVNAPVHTSGRQLSEKGGITWEFVSTDTGLMRITAVASATSATAVVVDRIPGELVTGDGAWTWAAAAWSAEYGWPAAIALHDQRLVFAATPGEPRTIWASAIGAFQDFTLGTDADLAFAYTIAAKRGINRILWLESGAKGLAIGALGELQAARSTVQGEGFSATTAGFDVVSSVGVYDAQPVSPDGYPIFISRDRGRILELKYSLTEDKVSPRELSMPARHLGAGKFAGIVWQSAPVRIGWLWRETGDLVAMIYEPDEDVLGWATMPVAGGVVENVSVSAAAGGGDDAVTLVVARTIGGEARRHVEQMAPFWGLLTGATDIAEAEHLYAAVVATPAAPAATFSGLDHLNGQAVLAWTDLGQFGPLTVAGGSITLSQPVSRAVIGLHLDEQRVRTLPLYAAVKDGDPMGRKVQTRRQGVYLNDTAAYRIRGVQKEWGKPEVMTDWRTRSGADVPGDLTVGYSGVDDPNVAIGWSLTNALEFAPVGAAPMTVLSLTPIVEASG
jgi:hypothetical protein